MWGFLLRETEAGGAESRSLSSSPVSGALPVFSGRRTGPFQRPLHFISPPPTFPFVWFVFRSLEYQYFFAHLKQLVAPAWRWQPQLQTY